MSIDPNLEIEPLATVQRTLAWVNVKDDGSTDGKLTAEAAALLQEFRDFMSGTARVIPCSASMLANVITLTPADSAPQIDTYRDYDIFVGAPDGGSTAAVTATVMPRSGSLATLKVYKTNGAAQAGNLDVVASSLYLFIFADHLDGGAGGFVMK